MTRKKHPLNDAIGKKYNMLTIVSWGGRKLGQPQYLCKCDCGNEKVVNYSKITSNGTKSCGCLTKTPEILTKEFLIDQCINQEKSGNQVSKEFNLNACTVYKYMKIYNIPTKTLKRDAITIEELEELYNSGCTLYDIAKKYNVSASFVHRRIKHISKPKNYNKIITKEFLVEEYITKNKGPQEISEDLGCNVITVSNYIRKFNLTKGRSCRSIENDITKQELEKLYIEDRLSLKDIAHIYGRNSVGGLTRLIKKWKIPTREGLTDKQKENGVSRKLHPYLYGGVLSKIRSGAKSRGIECNITLDDIWSQYLKQNKKCRFTGAELNFPSNSKEMYNTQYFNASVDRIDSSKGYDIDNIQIVLKDVNKMKWDMTDEDFINICKNIARNN